jgi:glycosyltransferase involved in cell wall biosynthesis
MSQRITLHAGLDSFRGYGLHLIEIARHFKKCGIHPAIRPLHTNEGFAKLPMDVRSLIVSGRQPEDWELLLSPPTVIPTPGKKTAFFTMWESSSLPEPSLTYVNRAEAVIVPSKWCYDVFKASGVTRPLFHVPLGVDTEIFRYQPMSQDGPTVFAVAGRTKHGRERKGLDAAIRSWKAAFPYDKNVRLLVKCHDDDDLPDTSDERIEVTRKHFTSHELANWLARANVFVTAATGEGWGLWAHQAMAIGRPVIAAVYGGLRDFMGDANCFPVAYREGETSGQWCGKWAYPDLGSMIEQMRYCHANRSEVSNVGVLAFETVKELTWARSCDELGIVLGQLGAFKRERNIFTMPKLTHGDYSIPRIPSVIEQCLARRWPVAELKFSVEADEVVFNPSIAGDTWFLRLSKTHHGNRDCSEIFAMKPDQTIVKIELPGLKGDWFEDPRAVANSDGFALSYTRVSERSFATQEIAFLDRSLQVVDAWHPNIGKNGISPKTATGPEKNWIWFAHDGYWHCIHWLDPMTVHQMFNGKSVDKYETSAVNPNWLHGIRHGGAHPTRIGDEFFGFCHSLMPWYSANRSRYFVSAYAFEAKPPFRMTRLSRQPLLRSDDDIRGNPCSCVICGGAVLNGDTWTLAIGARDEQCLKVEIPHAEVLADMVNV